MVRHGLHLHRIHPGVRTDAALTFGERAADILKRRFGSWPFLGILNAVFIAEIAFHLATHGNFDPGLLYLNLFLSWLAAQQGGALQIASNRSDQVAAEVSQHTYDNTCVLQDLLAENTALTDHVRAMTQLLHDHMIKPPRVRKPVKAVGDHPA